MADEEIPEMGRRAPELTPSPALRHRVFLLSPADCSGKRAHLLRNPGSEHELARRLRSSAGAELGEVFAFVSSLYFRGKLAYARAFARPPRGLDGIYVITQGDGLRVPEAKIRLEDLHRLAGVPIDPDEERYRAPLLRDLRELAPKWEGTDVVLLGSIASGKYVELLTSILGGRVRFPADFVGRGDMSRGGLLLRSARDGRELHYEVLLGAERRGRRPARLPPLT